MNPLAKRCGVRIALWACSIRASPTGDAHANSTVTTLEVAIGRPVALVNAKSLLEVIQAEQELRDLAEGLDLEESETL